MKKLITLLFFVWLGLNVSAQVPPPPNDDNGGGIGGGDPVGGNAPVGGGTLLLIALGAGYGLHKYRRNKSSLEE